MTSNTRTHLLLDTQANWEPEGGEGGRQLLFQHGKFQIDVLFQSIGRGHLSLCGQILPECPGFGRRATVAFTTARGEVVDSTQTDEFGQFSLVVPCGASGSVEIAGGSVRFSCRIPKSTSTPARVSA